MKKPVLFSALLAVMMLASAGPLSGQVKRFQGEWNNPDPYARGLVKLQIDIHRGAIVVHAWSACPVGPCYLGSSEGHVIVTAHWWNDTPSTLLVDYQLPFADELLVIELQKHRLFATTFTRFIDDSRRTDYVDHALFEH
jgi:hypothetical protein